MTGPFCRSVMAFGFLEPPEAWPPIRRIEWPGFIEAPNRPISPIGPIPCDETAQGQIASGMPNPNSSQCSALRFWSFRFSEILYCRPFIALNLLFIYGIIDMFNLSKGIPRCAGIAIGGGEREVRLLPISAPQPPVSPRPF